MASKTKLIVSVLVVGTLLLMKQEARSQDIAMERELKVHGLTPRVLDELKNSGIDVRTLMKHGESLDLRTQILFSKLIIVGLPVEVIDMPGPRSQPFHSRIIVKVMRILKGTASEGDTISVLKQDGPLQQEKKSVRFSNDIRLKLGQDVLLFLDSPRDNSYLESRYKGEFDRDSSMLTKNAYWGDSYSAYPVLDSSIKTPTGLKRLTEVGEVIRQIQSIVSSANNE